MEWLRIQLQILRDRGMKAILMGHVPPARVDSKSSWDETCWQKYTLWERQFRDVIVGGLYGHMNIDHFMLQDFNEISKDAERGRMSSSSGAMSRSEEAGKIELYEDGEVTVASASDYLRDLREAWAQLPAPPTKSNAKSHSESDDDDDDEELSIFQSLIATLLQRPKPGKPDKSDRKKYLEEIGGKFAERYSVTHVAPSVVPNYFPTLRIIEYNISSLEDMLLPSAFSASTPSSYPSTQIPLSTEDDDDNYAAYLQDVETSKKKHKKNHKSKGPRKYKFTIPSGPSKSSPPGPAYSPQLFTWTRYTQYFANLTRINNDFLESDAAHPSTPNAHSPTTIFGLNVTSTGEIDTAGWKEGKHGKHQGKQPRPEPHPNEFAYEVEYDTRKDKGFPDLTVRRWVEYARRIGAKGGKAADVQADDEDIDDEETDDVDATGKKHKKKKKKHHKGKKHRKASREWYTFVRRAFVGTMDPHEIKQVFGAVEEEEGSVQEGLEL